MRGSLDFALVQQWDENKKDSYSFAGPAALGDDELHQVSVGDLKKEAKSFDSKILWSSLQSKYFMAVAILVQPTSYKILA